MIRERRDTVRSEYRPELKCRVAVLDILPHAGHLREQTLDAFRDFVLQMGLGYHPDTPISEYRIGKRGEKGVPFAPEIVEALTSLESDAWEHCDPFEESLDMWRRFDLCETDPEAMDEYHDQAAAEDAWWASR